MFKKIIFLSMCLLSVFADTCFTQDDINGSNKLFIYKGDIYDTSGYNHPGGNNDIKKLVGNDLSDFVNSNTESFHLSSSKFYKQLDNMYVGKLEKTCLNTTESTTSPTSTNSSTDSTTTTDSPKTRKTTTTDLTTSTELTTTTDLTTSTELTTTTDITASTNFTTPTNFTAPTNCTINPTTTPKIVNSSYKITSCFLFATFLLIFNTIYNI